MGSKILKVRQKISNHVLPMYHKIFVKTSKYLKGKIWKPSCYTLEKTQGYTTENLLHKNR